MLLKVNLSSASEYIAIKNIQFIVPLASLFKGSIMASLGHIIKTHIEKTFVENICVMYQLYDKMFTLLSTNKIKIFHLMKNINYRAHNNGYCEP